MSPKNAKDQSWIRYSSIGFEFTAAVAVFALIGWWIDRSFGWFPWGTLIAAALGMIGATYNLIRVTMAAFKDTQPRGKDDQPGKQASHRPEK